MAAPLQSQPLSHHNQMLERGSQRQGNECPKLCPAGSSSGMDTHTLKALWGMGKVAEYSPRWGVGQRKGR